MYQPSLIRVLIALPFLLITLVIRVGLALVVIPLSLAAAAVGFTVAALYWLVNGRKD